MSVAATGRVLMIFVDGLGLGCSDPAVNPIQPEICPCLAGLLKSARPIDACLGIEGLPQSATGQTALLTGVNAPQLVGRHIEGFPGSRLVRVIEDHNIFKVLAALGRRTTFANGYFVEDAAEARACRIKSVTTVSTLSGLGTVRNRYALECNEAVCQDLTRETLRERGYDGPLITPAQAAEHLLGIAATHDFTLFEYFQTDRAGHTADFERAQNILRTFDAFLAVVLGGIEAQGDLSLVLTSDHGNIEDLSVRAHTRNPVPFVVAGHRAERLTENVHAITDVAAAIVRCLSERGTRTVDR